MQACLLESMFVVSPSLQLQEKKGVIQQILPQHFHQLSHEVREEQKTENVEYAQVRKFFFILCLRQPGRPNTYVHGMPL